VYYDFFGDGRLRWELRNSNTAGPPDKVFTYGTVSDVPVVGDWDGDGTTTPGVVRDPNLWLLRNAVSGGSAQVSFAYGSPRDDIIELPVPGDWDGNGTDTPAVLRNIPATKREGGFQDWYARNSNSGGSANVHFVFGSDAFTEFLPIEYVFRLSLAL
jgi:hypothetical protein